MAVDAAGDAVPGEAEPVLHAAGCWPLLILVLLGQTPVLSSDGGYPVRTTRRAGSLTSQPSSL